MLEIYWKKFHWRNNFKWKPKANSLEVIVSSKFTEEQSSNDIQKIHEKIVNMPHLRSCIFTENELRRWLFLVQSLWNLQNCLKSIHAFLWGEYFCYMMEMQNIQSKVLSRSCTVLYWVDAAFWLESCLTSSRSWSANSNTNCMWIVL